jgi:uncharacterized protein
MSEFRFIDSHVHLYPEPLNYSLLKWFDECAWPVKYRVSVDEIIKLLMDLGAETLVIYNHSHKAGFSSYLNEWNCRLAQQYPDLIVFAAAHPEDDNLSMILKEAFVDYGLYGVKIQCLSTAIAPDDERIFPIYEKIIEYDKILTIHAGTGPRRSAPVTGCLLPMYDFDPGEVCGVERFKRVLKRYPNLRCIFPHKINPECLIEFQDRILYGSNTPSMPYELDTEIRCLKNLGLGEEVETKIFYSNAKRLFKLS